MTITIIAIPMSIENTKRVDIFVGVVVVAVVVVVMAVKVESVSESSFPE